jgi:hypothetical protein
MHSSLRILTINSVREAISALAVERDASSKPNIWGMIICLDVVLSVCGKIFLKECLFKKPTFFRPCRIYVGRVSVVSSTGRCVALIFTDPKRRKYRIGTYGPRP